MKITDKSCTFVVLNYNVMKKILATLMLVGVMATGFAQDITKSGLYNSRGKAIVIDKEAVAVNVTLRVSVESFTPGIYARYAQKYLGKRATLSKHSTIEIVEGRLALGVAEKPATKVEQELPSSPLPINKMSATAQDTEAQAAATAEMIFSLRKHRLELITGEAGENVFGAGLKAALDEIARIERECLDMFYGTKTVEDQLYTFNLELTPSQSEYMVCRFSDKEGVVGNDNLSGLPVVVKVESEQNKEYAQLQPVYPKDKMGVEYVIVPKTTCTLVAETTLLDTLNFVSPAFGQSVYSLRIK